MKMISYQGCSDNALDIYKRLNLEEMHRTSRIAANKSRLSLHSGRTAGDYFNSGICVKNR
jgi:hypothetical protein